MSLISCAEAAPAQPRDRAIRLATASFLYVAMSDLIPDLHRGTFDDNPIRQVLLVSAGIATVMAL